jgi:hypothetical protein
VAGVTDVANEIELRAAGDHRSSVPHAQAVPAVPPAMPAMPIPGLSELDSALRMATRDIPVTHLLRAGHRELERGRPEAAMEAFTAALSLDPGNREAATGARDAARQIKEKAEAEQKRAVPPPPGPR